MASNDEKSYSGGLMKKGSENEVIILEWLNSLYKNTLDFREFKLSQRMDIDFGIETWDGNIILAEIKSDHWISENGNLCFEVHRINHHVKNKWFYLGWGWRSPAQKLIVRNPNSKDTFVFEFDDLRQDVANYINKNSSELKTLRAKNNKDFILVVPTDKQKTTFNWLIPMQELKYKKFIV